MDIVLRIPPKDIIIIFIDEESMYPLGIALYIEHGKPRYEKNSL